MHMGVVAFMASGLVIGGLLALDHRAQVAPETRTADVPAAVADLDNAHMISR